MPGNANKINISAGLFKAFNFEQLTIAATAVGLTTATYTTDGEKAKRALITCETAQLRYRYDGTDPTATVGHMLNPFDVLVLTGSDNITNFRAIRAGGTSATLFCTYEN